MKKRRLLPLAAVFATLALLGAGCYSKTASTNTNTSNSFSSSNSISISGMAFNASNTSVKVGTKVTWTNNDSVTHTITGDNGGPSSGNIAPGANYSYTFSTAGTFPYHCSIHPSMTGTVTVTQ